MWSEGTIGIPDAKDKGKYTVCHYWVKHYEEPSEEYGINGGKISKLMIKINGTIQATVFRFIVGIAVGIGKDVPLNRMDARNEQAVICSQQIADMIADDHLALGGMV